MRVVELTRFGGPEVLVPGEAQAPSAGVGEVVVKVAVAGITFVETQIRRGVDKWHEVPEPPYVPGGIVAGVVITTGKRVDTGWLGRRVLADPGMTGSFAEQAAAPVKSLIADAVVDYSTVDWTAGIGPVDVVFDGVGGEIGRAAFALLRRGGRFSVHGASSGSVSDAHAAIESRDALGKTLLLTG
ncbi:zinc-binding dehydrogenase [Allokutzneria sp. A3M-2-11 16]|uniref:alcohol dehydrogenase catalytic domain-containing protein n=1 Tax=Allokutzneria sp. A3M-2-11 16 TaxID=2962043 RepID=UPI0020B6A2A8|nr:zinc-binding dehydrogenase [Allokutzneria sp. A3M-2-11 16]MCP3802850.1 zinc-binding dehydrogenase [Allokutzneria sp. A3M-2-11 16]